MKEKQLVFNREWWTSIRVLNREDRIQLLDNLMMSYFEGKEPELMSEDAAGAWSQIQKAIKERFRQRIKVRKYRKSGTVPGEEETRNKEESSSSQDPLTKEEKKKKEEEKKAHERAFDEAFKRSYPRLGSLAFPLTFEQYLKILRNWPYSLVCDVLRRMESYTKVTRYRYVNLILLNWLRHDKKMLQEANLWSAYESEYKRQKIALEPTSSSPEEKPSSSTPEGKPHPNPPEGGRLIV